MIFQKLFIVLAVAVTLQWSSTAKAFDLWPGIAPNETSKIGPERKVQDGTQSGCGPLRNDVCYKIFNVSTPTLSPYLVRNGTGAAVIIAPGGGYSIVAISKEGEDIARLYNSLGVSAFLLKYRVPARPDAPGLPHWWAPLQDAQRAISIVRHGAAIGRWGSAVNASRVGFTGFSAGGHLTAHVSTAWRNGRAYAPVDENDNASCRPDFSIFFYPWFLLPGNKAPEWGKPYALASEFTNGKGSPNGMHPVSMFVHNEDDPVAPVQGTSVYHSKLLAVGASMSSMHISPKGGHGFGLCQNGFENYEEVCDWPKLVQRFLQHHSFAPGLPNDESGEPRLKDMLEQNCPI